LSSFSLVTFGFEIFWRQNIGKKVAHKMLMKVTTPDITKPFSTNLGTKPQ